MIPIRIDEPMMNRRDGRPAIGGNASAWLDQEGYERWLLPPLPRDALERFVHTLSLSAGVIALVAVSAGMWLAI